MSIIRQTDPDLAAAPLVGQAELWPPGSMAPHHHQRHQLMYAATGVVHVLTAVGEWVLPPSRAIWISGSTEHELIAKRHTDTRVLYIDTSTYQMPVGEYCVVIGVTPLVRELISACTELPWDYQVESPEGRLAQVLIDQIRALHQDSADLPLPSDPRALRIVDILRREPANREPLSELASRVGASPRTIERLFQKDTHLSFGIWRQRMRLLIAIERLAYGESVTNVALDVGYESASSFVAAFRSVFGNTPARYFKT
ncbi:helix-turn-helix transcriptional regulator [Herbaspirillum sp. LeCh32-8]|uniref:AraC family transcriptional regulator n=1 Tax=Herbaspirillum sp. LeCh32-8 TaxID=2821356 RepID=UPI001AE1A299|nr:helix-turn-helix transcriptional regulator [Herbaspirillum sp. LeCh32-8]MBP0598870.1 helix-turn-helix transcriptional regulator [Herbaspirillum sp. LeCh32-8]